MSDYKKRRTLAEIIGDWEAPEDYEMCEFVEEDRIYRIFSKLYITSTENPVEGGYVVSCKGIPSCPNCGETIPKAADSFKDTIKVWLAVTDAKSDNNKTR